MEEKKFSTDDKSVLLTIAVDNIVKRNDRARQGESWKKMLGESIELVTSVWGKSKVGKLIWKTRGRRLPFQAVYVANRATRRREAKLKGGVK